MGGSRVIGANRGGDADQVVLILGMVVLADEDRLELRDVSGPRAVTSGPVPACRVRAMLG
jgi:hypothetical protein